MRSHSGKAVENQFIFSILLTGIVFLFEIIGGIWTGSLALVSDSLHVFLDLFALGLSFFAIRLSSLPADDRHTYGYHRFEVIAALINGITLGIIALGIFSEAWERWRDPQPVKGLQMLVIAVAGLILNLIVVFILRGKHEHVDHGHRHYDDLNIRSAYLHVIGDAISSFGVILAAIIILYTGALWVDPIMSVLIGIFILFSAGRLLKKSIHILIEGTPEDISLEKIGETILSTPGVVEVHDLHVWSLCSGHVSLSTHALITQQAEQERGLVLMEINRRLRQDFQIEHTTIQLETVIPKSNQVIQIA